MWRSVPLQPLVPTYCRWRSVLELHFFLYVIVPALVLVSFLSNICDGHSRDMHKGTMPNQFCARNWDKVKGSRPGSQGLNKRGL